MQPPFDLNLMKTVGHHDPQELLTKAETNRNISECRAEAMLTGWERLQSAWTVLKDRVVKKPADLQS